MQEQECIYTIYKEGSFSAAAKKLYLSQPALSMAVKKTEKQLGIKIFNRTTIPLTLTEEGKVYIAAAEEVMSVKRAMENRLADMAELKSGNVTVSGDNFTSAFILPKILVEFSRKYSGINVEIVESNSPDLRKQLLSEGIDLLLAHDFDEKLYSARELIDERVFLAVAKSNPINKQLSRYALKSEDIVNGNVMKKAVDLSLFKEENFIILKQGNDMKTRAERLCAEAGFTPRASIKADQLITSYNLASAGMGVAFVPDILVKKAAVTGCVYYMLESEYAKRKMCVGYKKNRYLNKAAAAFIETAKQVYNGK